jgi:hypothetical protein
MAAADGGRQGNSIWVGANRRLGEESLGKNQLTRPGLGWTARVREGEMMGIERGIGLPSVFL